MKTAVSIPDPVFAAAERLAKRLGLSRSEVYRRALESFLDQYDDALVTDRVNAVLGDPLVPSGLEPEVAELQYHSLRKAP